MKIQRIDEMRNLDTDLNSLNEYSDSPSPCNIIFVTQNPKNQKFGEFGRFYQSGKKYGVNVIGIDVDKDTFSFENGDLILNRSMRFSKDNTVLFFRHAVRIGKPQEEKKLTHFKLKSLKQGLRENGFAYSNPGKVTNICRDKKKTFEALNGKAPVIDTLCLTLDEYEAHSLDNAENLINYLKKEGFTLPLVVKIVDGTQGLGIFCCKDENILVSTIQYLLKTKKECIVQRYCDIDYDLRVHVFCKTLHPETADLDDFIIIGSMKRSKAPHDFRTNYSVGGEISQIDLNDEEIAAAKLAAKTLGAVWCGVDICFDKITKKSYILEVNGSPALKGISQISDVLPTDLIVKSIKEYFVPELDEEDDVYESRKVVSYYETIHLDGVGDMKGCFDTGNSSLCAIKSHYVKEKDGKLTVELNGKKITKDIVRHCTILASGHKTKRPVVKFDMSLNGKIIKDVEVCVRETVPHEKDKKAGVSVLLSTKTIDRFNVLVHPDRKEKYKLSK